MQNPASQAPLVCFYRAIEVPFFRRVEDAAFQALASRAPGLTRISVKPDKIDALLAYSNNVGVISLTPEVDSRGLPLVVISNGDTRKGPFVRVVNDDFAIGRMAARHLADAGAKSLMTLEWYPQHVSDLRLDGFRREAERLEIPFVIAQTSNLNLLDPMGYAREMDAFFRENFTNISPDTGIFTANDDRMRPVMSALKSAKLRVPEDVLLVGVDDLGRDPDSGCTRLSSVEPDAVTLAERAVETLLAWMASGEPPPAVPPVPPLRVVQRASTFRGDLIDPALQAMHRIRSGEFMDDNAETLAEAVGVSRVTLYRHFKREYGRPPHEVIVAYRMRRARELLQNSSLTVERIAVACGYTHASTFVHAFKQAHHGVTPGQWREGLKHETTLEKSPPEVPPISKKAKGLFTPGT